MKLQFSCNCHVSVRSRKKEHSLHQLTMKYKYLVLMAFFAANSEMFAEGQGQATTTATPNTTTIESGSTEACKSFLGHP